MGWFVTVNLVHEQVAYVFTSHSPTICCAPNECHRDRRVCSISGNGSESAYNGFMWVLSGIYWGSLCDRRCQLHVIFKGVYQSLLADT